MSGLDPRLLIAGDFIMLRMALVDALDGDIEAALVLQRIAWRCERDGFWKATHEDIQQETRLSEWKVKTALKTLRDKGFLNAERAGAYDPTLVWTIRYVTEESSNTVTEETSVTPSTKTGETSIGDAGAPPSPLTQFALLDSPPVPTGGKGGDDDGFDEFWSAYPKKVDKGAARRAWKAAVKKAKADRIIAAATRYAAERKDKERTYTKNPSSWLNAEAWDNEPEPVQQSAGVWQPTPNKWSI